MHPSTTNTIADGSNANSDVRATFLGTPSMICALAANDKTSDIKHTRIRNVALIIISYMFCGVNTRSFTRGPLDNLCGHEGRARVFRNRKTPVCSISHRLSYLVNTKLSPSPEISKGNSEIYSFFFCASVLNAYLYDAKSHFNEEIVSHIFSHRLGANFVGGVCSGGR